MRSKFIDYAKGFSILTIVIYHLYSDVPLPGIVSTAINFGGAGVHLFFFLSGFGLATSTYTTFPAFLKRRFSKVYIPYFICITLIFLSNFYFKFYDASWKEYLSHVFLFKMFVPAYETSFGGQFWFISTIIQFYLVFPLLLFFSNRVGSRNAFIAAFVVSITFSVLLSLTAYSEERVLNGCFLQYLWEFMLGMWLAKSGKLEYFLERPFGWYVITAFVAIALTAVLAIKGGRTGRNLNDIFSFIGYTSVVVIAYRLSRSYFPRLNSVVLWVTGFSFSLYLVHNFIWNFLGTRELLLLPMMILVTVMVAYVYDVLVQRIVARLSV